MKVYRVALVIPLVLDLLLAPLTTEAQPTGKIHRIGHLVFARREQVSSFIAALDEGLRELGYVEGRDAHLHLPVLLPPPRRDH